jgi:hypothetical protein
VFPFLNSSFFIFLGEKERQVPNTHNTPII